MHMAAVRWSLLPRNQQCPRNIRYRSKKSKSLFSCRCSKRSLLSQQSTLPCVFRDNLRSTGWVYMEGWDNPTVRVCCGLIAQGRGQRRSPDPPSPGCSAPPTKSRSTRGEQTLGVRLAKQWLTRSERPTPWLMFVLVNQRLQKMWLLATFIITVSLVKHTGIKQFSVVSY